MKLDELDSFLARVEAKTLEGYFELSPAVDAAAALDAKMQWAAWHFRDPKHGPEAEFVMMHAALLKDILDEGEEAWRARTAAEEPGQHTGNREHDPWQQMRTFGTPAGVARRTAGKTILPPEDLDFDGLLPPVDDEDDDDDDEYVDDDPTDASVTLLPPEDMITPSDPPRRSDEETDPVGFTAALLADEALEERTYALHDRSRPHSHGSGYEMPADPGIATGAQTYVDWEHFDPDELTDPSGPVTPLTLDPHSDEVPIPPSLGPPPGEDTTATVPVATRGRGFPLAALLLGAIILLVGGVVLALVAFDLSARQVSVPAPVEQPLPHEE